jgi:hypothetical protein
MAEASADTTVFPGSGKIFPAFEGDQSAGQEFPDSGRFMENSFPIGLAAGPSSVVMSGGDLLERRHEPIVSSGEA